MPNSAKISITMSPDDLKWAKRRAKMQKRALSAVIADAVAKARQDEARQQLLRTLPEVSDAEIAAVEAEWAAQD
ncbi:MAG: hypothetical protein OXT09_11445 [Myxococcales bacterium]|nr:hypothetical protein [Myxococcales bacterium]